MRRGIGGFPSAAEFLNSGRSYYFNSFRSSLRALLISARIKKISIPVYYCHEVTEFIKDTGVDVKFYNIDESFLPLNPDFSDGRVLLYPNYFGVNGVNVVSLLDTYNPNRIVIDGAQALVSKYDCLANINSYRKFLPVVDGSLLITPLRIEASPPSNSCLADAEHLLNENRNAAYEQFKAHEVRFSVVGDDNGISVASLIGVGCTDFGSIAASRFRHYTLYESVFQRFNKIRLGITDGMIPLCYPLMLDSAPKREQLINAGIYVPNYWAMHSALNYTPFEKALASEAIFLPLDQTLSSEDISGTISTVTEFLE